MASEGSDGPAAPKSKQERIRDNQRRSRARRQEYLAELQRRLNECHNAFREAELQREAFAHLQTENARLRELLNFAGVSPEVVESYGRQHNHRADDSTAASLRQIKPKLQSMDASGHPSPLHIPKLESNGALCCPTSSSCCTSQPGLPLEHFHGYDGQFRRPHQFLDAPATIATTLFQTTAMSPATSSQWLIDTGSEGPAASYDDTFSCDTFRVPPKGPLLPDDGNTTLCSMAKALIDQCNPTPSEMEEIRARLATAFSRPTFPEQGCRVNNQVLCQILSEMNAKANATMKTDF
ncbi:uncharacterized protein Z518_04448 [Rhinocladiella mackenziei CBS 650.93]|uniref:BZIP domain-containing protein n=1 Tax=Rhinocladiella mackenziei CBS 650.93 TaxID=1442369 RepID=A0A0D2FWC7_9EURO|nr:uncharacterized protein Z518_04448 [Rhinocladiella mackenziei CBS 650.93]KIX06472.1 hypothetical protein Z518_04448 [Rhinocladiella mackenziei CBS 650.93]